MKQVSILAVASSFVVLCFVSTANAQCCGSMGAPVVNSYVSPMISSYVEPSVMYDSWASSPIYTPTYTTSFAPAVTYSVFTPRVYAPRVYRTSYVRPRTYTRYVPCCN